MLYWLSENISSIIICVLLIALVVFIIERAVRNRRNGKASCTCSCGGCPMNGACNKNKQ